MSPPKWPLRILERFCDPELFDEIEGDLSEMFDKWVEVHGIRKARQLYILHTFKFIRPFIFKRKTPVYSGNFSAMMYNHFKTAWRNISGSKGFTAINVLGLSLGLTCAIVIYTLVTYHLSFDNYHQDLNRVYRVVMDYQGDDLEHWADVPQPLGGAIVNDFTYTEKMARYRMYRSLIISLPDEPNAPKFQEDGTAAFVEPEFFDIFEMPLVRGESKRLLTEPNTALLTQSMAIKYFGTDDAIGKVIKMNSFGASIDFKVTGILKDPPPNTELRRQIYFSYVNMKQLDPHFASDRSWGSTLTGMRCFVKLKPGVTREEVNAALPGLVKKYYDDFDEKLFTFLLQPMADAHLDPKYGAAFSHRQIVTLTITGLFLVLIACINFINLATAQGLNRAKEVGIRKILGSLRSYIFLQFIVETFVVALIAVMLSIVIAYLILPWVNMLLGERLSIDLFGQWQLPAFIFSAVIVVVLMAGIYPALLLSRFQPARVVSVRLSEGRGLSLRRTLIVGQFVISQMLIICMIVINSQMKYSRNAELGFTRETVLLLPLPNPDKVRMKTLAARAGQVAGVQSASLCYQAPASTRNNTTGVRFAGDQEDRPFEINLKDGDENFLKTFQLSLVAGRDLLPADSMREFIVNETFVKKVGLASPDEAIGERLGVNGNSQKGTIVGVVKDFHNNSFHEGISPICIMFDIGDNETRYRTLALRINAAQISDVLPVFNQMWTEAYPDNIFTYSFMDDTIEAFYKADETMLILVQIVAGIAILISCLGLYGMVSFMAVRKTKEIGVRKVLGASIPSILWMFAREFSFLIAVAFIVAAPLAWYFMDQWLQGFAYRVDVSPLSFMTAVIATLVVSTATVSYHSLKSAFSNPVKSLRTE